MFCKECGNEVAPTSGFCARCGTPVLSQLASSPVGAAPAPTHMVPPAPTYTPVPVSAYSSVPVPRPAPGAERTLGIVLMIMAVIGVPLGSAFSTLVQQMYYTSNLPYSLISIISAISAALMPLTLTILAFIGMGFAARLRRQGLPSAWFSGAATADIIAGFTFMLIPFINIFLVILTNFAGFTYAMSSSIQFVLTLIGGGAAIVVYGVASGKSRELASANAGIGILSGVALVLVILYTLFRLFIQPQLVTFLASNLGMSVTDYAFVVSALMGIGSMFMAAFFVLRGLFWMRASTKTQPK